jgi:hypothetical protein
MLTKQSTKFEYMKLNSKPVELSRLRSIELPASLNGAAQDMSPR